MPTAVTISSVNTGTDRLTATAHGLLTGDRFRVRTVGGVLPAPLAAVTDYFAIRDDANNIRVATTSANALADVAIDLTTAGSGTNLIEYGLPYCVPRVATSGSQIVAADDNAAWNSFTALHALVTGQAQTVWNGVSLAGSLSLAGGIANTVTLTEGATIPTGKLITLQGTADIKHGDRTTGHDAARYFVIAGTITPSASSDIPAWTISSAGTGLFIIDGLRRGDRLKSVKLWWDLPGSATLTVATVGTGSKTVHETSTSGDSLSGTATLNTPYELGANDLYATIKVTVTGGNGTIYGIEKTYDRP